VKKIRNIFLLTIVLSLFSITAASAGGGTTGQRIDLLSGPDTVTLNEGDPFYVYHGFTCGYCRELREYGLWNYPCGAGHTPFTLALNGQNIHFSYFRSLPDNKWPVEIYGVVYMFKFKMYMYTYNFPDGLEADTYTMTGTWYSACAFLYDDCIKPSARVVHSQRTITLIVE
jgi:hypothetical protein